MSSVPVLVVIVAVHKLYFSYSKRCLSVPFLQIFCFDLAGVVGDFVFRFVGLEACVFLRVVPLRVNLLFFV